MYFQILFPYRLLQNTESIVPQGSPIYIYIYIYIFTCIFRFFSLIDYYNTDCIVPAATW